MTGAAPGATAQTAPQRAALDVPIVDAHFHLWDRTALAYPWLEAAGMAAIAPTYRMADYHAETAGWPLVGAVHVEAGTAPGQGADETRWLEDHLADEAMPVVLVAATALDAPDVAAHLAWQASRPRVRGIRHLVNWHSDPRRCAYPSDLTRDPAWRRGYAMLGQYGLSFDFHGFPPQLAGLAEVAAAHPEVPLVIDHLGLPIREDGLSDWRAGMTALARLGHVSVKLSGAGLIDAPFDGASFVDVLDEVLDLFGPARILAASNFPTDRLFAPLDATWSAYAAWAARLSMEQQRALWGGNADRVYRIGIYP